MKVAVFVGTRADLGPLEPVLVALGQAADVDLHVLSGISYDASALAERLAASGIAVAKTHALTAPMSSVAGDDMLSQGARVVEGARTLFAEIHFDVLVILGDRWELLFVVPAAFLARIRIVHIHGGEVTEGAIDDRVRHAVTKLADMHCVASTDAADRVAQMGEQPERIRITGAPGLDRLVAAPPMTDDALASYLGAPIGRPLALFTYHPPTADRDADVAAQATAALRGALAHCSTVIVTDPGMDSGRDEIIAAVERFAATDDRVVLVQSLGPLYPQVLAAADVVVGNSSSGVIEAATVGVPAVDIGERQAGRLRSASVVHADESLQSITEAVAEALSPGGRRAAREAVNPYGDGQAAARIVSATREVLAASFVKPFREAGVK